MNESPRHGAHGASRRTFLGSTAAAAGAAWLARGATAAPPPPESRQASGVKVGEVTDSTALVWTRLTRDAARVDSPHRVEGAAKGPEEALPAAPDQLEGACPGAPGRIRVRYVADPAPANTPPREPAESDWLETEWAEVGAATDYSHTFALRGLASDTRYRYEVETCDPEGQLHAPRRGEFRTAPAAETPTRVRCGFINCQKFHTREAPEGFQIYESLRQLEPAFVVFTGDNVYYDSDRPRATSIELARYHWQRCYSLPRHEALLSSVGTYWLKDDHDVHSDDVFPQRRRKQGKFTFEQGLEVWREQVPLDQPYRTIRWGRDLQIWLVEGRDFRSANSAPDGPEKSIWGAEQKAWLRRTLAESDATWRILISPTPLVGPDRPGKGDNHSNQAFAHEGHEMRRWLAEQLGPQVFVVCGDRHWQYHSVDPETGLNEFSIGAASAGNAGGTPGLDRRYHRFHRVRAGFLTIDVEPVEGSSQITFQLRDIHGGEPYVHRAMRS